MVNSLSSEVRFSFSPGMKIPVITLSNNYDFRESSAKTTGFPEASESFPVLNNVSTPQTTGGQLLNLGTGQTFSSQEPIIYGKAAPNTSVHIIIHSTQQIETTVISDQNGNWSYQPTVPLTTGNHTIIVTAKDAAGTTKTVTQNFTITPPQASPTKAVAVTTGEKPGNLLTPTSTNPFSIKNMNGSVITAIIIGLLITVVGGLIFLLTRKGL